MTFSFCVGSFTYTITDRKVTNGEKVEKIRTLSDVEYEVYTITLNFVVRFLKFLLCLCRHSIGRSTQSTNLL